MKNLCIVALPSIREKGCLLDLAGNGAVHEVDMAALQRCLYDNLERKD